MKKIIIPLFFVILFIGRSLAQSGAYTLGDLSTQKCNDLPEKHRLTISFINFLGLEQYIGMEYTPVDSIRKMIVTLLKPLNCFNLAGFANGDAYYGGYGSQLGLAGKFSVIDGPRKMFKKPKLVGTLTGCIIDIAANKIIDSGVFTAEVEESGMAKSNRFYSKENVDAKQVLYRELVLQYVKYFLSKKEKLTLAYPTYSGFDEYTPLNVECPTGVFHQDKLSEEAETEYEKASKLVSDANYKDALPHYIKAALLGHSDAALEIGIYLIKGTYIKTDINDGIKWLKFAAANGNNVAYTQLASLKTEYSISDLKGNTYILDSIAAVRGTSDAAINLGYLYKKGSENLQYRYKDVNIEPNSARSAYWYRQANKMLLVATLELKKDNSIIKGMGAIVNKNFNDIGKVVVVASSLTTPIQYQETDYKVNTFIVTKFTGHLLSNGLVDTDQPFEIECKGALGLNFFSHFKINFRRVNGLLVHSIMYTNFVGESELATYQMQMPDDYGFEMGLRNL